MSKTLALMLFTLLVLSSLVIVGSAFAQSITKPSVPEFTVELVDHSYVVPETTSIDPYTGEEVIHPSYTVENKTIDITIKKQPSVAGLSYNVRAKGHFEEKWTELFYYDESGGSDLPTQSTSGDTVISISQKGYPDEGVVDFQVEAVIVTRHLLYPDYPSLSWLARWTYETSGWSSTQTLTLGENQTPSPEPTSTPTPTASPEPTTSIEPALVLSIAALVLSMVAFATVLVFGLVLLYRIKRK